VTQGRTLGRVVIKLDDKLISERDLVALQAVAEGDFWQRIVDEGLLYFE